MRTGNVIEAPGGSIWIVTGVHTKSVSAVSFDSENVSATQSLEDYEREVACSCSNDWTVDPDSECSDCHGAGRYKIPMRGWKHSKVLAPSVKDFIMNGLKKVWGL